MPYVCMSTVGVNMTAGISSIATQAHSGGPSLQPIGAERRRQTASIGSIASITTSNIYPNMMLNNHPGVVYSNQQHNLHGGLTANVASNNPTAYMSGTPGANASPQSCNLNPNANNLFMAFTMNWMQQHQSAASGCTNLPHPPNWSHSLWPNANCINTCNNNNNLASAGTGFAPIKIPGDYNMGANSSVLPNPLPNLNGTSGQQHQHQTMVAAAMAAMANIYPWNQGPGTNSSLTVSGVSNAMSSSTRWINSQPTTAVAGVFQNANQIALSPLLYQDHHSMQPPFTALMSNGTVTGTVQQSGSAHYSQAL